jgi:hypothetical protein
MLLATESRLLVPGLPFLPEQQAAVCALVPAGADDEEVQGALRLCEHLAAAHKEYVQRRQGVPFPPSIMLTEWTPPEKREEHGLGPTMSAEEFTARQTWDRKISFANLRNDWVRFEKLMRDAAQLFERLMPPLATPEADEFTIGFRWLRQLHETAAARAAGYTTMAEVNAYPKDSHRELVYIHVLHIWTSLGGKLSMSHDPIRVTTTGPVIPFFRLVTSLIFDEPPLSDSTIIEILRREIDRRKGKKPRKRLRNRRKK